MKISVFLISLSLVITCRKGAAQSDSVYADSSWHALRFVPTGVRLGADLISFGQGVQKNGIRAITQGDARQWKFNADIDFYRYFLNIEYGKFGRSWASPEGFYQNDGHFFKFGSDVNFLHRDPDQSALFIGLRYAVAKFSDGMTYAYSNTIWGNGSLSKGNRNLRSRWYELTTGLKVKLSGLLWMGYTARFKFGVNDHHSSNQLIPHWIPGYGFAGEESQWGFEYWLIIRIPFKTFIPAPPK